MDIRIGKKLTVCLLAGAVAFTAQILARAAEDAAPTSHTDMLITEMKALDSEMVELATREGSIKQAMQGEHRKMVDIEALAEGNAEMKALLDRIRKDEAALKELKTDLQHRVERHPDYQARHEGLQNLRRQLEEVRLERKRLIEAKGKLARELYGSKVPAQQEN